MRSPLFFAHKRTSFLCSKSQDIYLHDLQEKTMDEEYYFLVNEGAFVIIIIAINNILNAQNQVSRLCKIIV